MPALISSQSRAVRTTSRVTCGQAQSVDQSELGLAANRAGARTERGRRERVWTKPNAEGRMFSGWTIWGSNVPGLFACFYPVGGITLWP